MTQTNPLPQNVSGSSARRRWMRAVLVISLTLNLLVLGLIVGAQLGAYGPRGTELRASERGALRELGFGPMAGALSHEDRHYVGRKLRESTGSLQQNRAELEREFQAMLAALRSEPFQAGALENIMEQQSERFRARGAAIREIVVERISQMSVEERRAFADRVEASVRRHGSAKDR